MTQPHRPVGPGDHVFLVDGSSFVFRAYFQSIRQDQKYNYRSDRLPIGAVRLFATKVLQFVKDGAAGIKPTHLAIIFDKSENSFRRELYPPYKGNRSEPPADLVPQFPLMRATVRAFGMVPVEQDRYEADDLIATYARQACDRGADVLIVSADKDLMQLIEPRVAMYDPASGDREERRIGPAEVFDYFGVGPDKVVDVQALAGNSTDNVPGAPGIGVKTAAQLIGEFGDLETLLARAGEIKQPKRREALTLPENVNRILISQKLVTLVRDVELETPLDDLAAPALDGKELVAFLKAMELTTITRRVGELTGVDVSAIEPDPRFAGPAGWLGRDGEAALAVDASPTTAPAHPQAPPAAPEGATPAELARTRAAEGKAPVDRSTYKTVRKSRRSRSQLQFGHAVRRHAATLAQSRGRRERPFTHGSRARTASPPAVLAGDNRRHGRGGHLAAAGAGRDRTAAPALVRRRGRRAQGRRGEVAKPLRAQPGDARPASALPRDHPQGDDLTRPSQAPDRRPRPVRRCAAGDRAGGARRGLHLP